MSLSIGRLSTPEPPHVVPLAAPSPPLLEFTVKAVGIGALLGVIFGAANAYLGLRAGMTVSASIPAAVMTAAVFRLWRRPSTLLEANMSQTVASASTALATGTIYTVPALFLWGAVPPYWQVVGLCFVGGLLGITAMIPLRRLLIVQSAAELPYPEGQACAEVLRSTMQSAGGSAWIFWGIGIGALLKLLLSVGFVVPAELGFDVPVLPKAHAALAVAPALVAIGFILGYRQAAVIVSGALLSAFVLIPMIAHFGASVPGVVAPASDQPIALMQSHEIWSAYVRYIGAGAVALAAVVTVGKNLPTMGQAFLKVVRGLTKSGLAQHRTTERTDRDLPAPLVIGGLVAVILAVAFVPGLLAPGMTPAAQLVAALGVAVLGVVFVTVAARIVGIIGVSSQPTSGIALITLMVIASAFVMVGWVDTWARAAVLTVGTIVAIAASKAGDIAQDLKTGALVGATPAKQQYGQLVGAACACWGVAATVLLLGSVYTFGSKELPAPQAMLMKTVVEGLLSGQLPWELLGFGVGIALPAVLCGINGLAFGIGVYLPLASMAAIFLGGCVRRLCDALGARKSLSRDDDSVHRDPSVLAASGIVAGEGLAGVLVAGLVSQDLVPKDAPPLLTGVPGQLGALLLTAVLCGFLVLSSRARAR